MKPSTRIAFWIVVAGQLVFLLAFIAVKEVDLLTGRDVVLQTVPVDPRSLLQGDYAILDYEIATLPEYMKDADKGTSIYVILKEGPEVWEALDYLPDIAPAGEVFIKGRVDHPGHLDFAIGTYFVPEGTGHIIEGAEDIKVVANINSDGTAVIKQVLVNGWPFDPDMEAPEG